MDRTPVRSSNIRSVGYDANEQTLEIEFTSWAIYQYFGVPLHVHEGLMMARSKGTYFNEHVKDKYRFKQIRRAR